MKSATHSENNRGASIQSLSSVLISEYLGLGSSTSPTWDRTRFQQTRGRGAAGNRTIFLLYEKQEKHPSSSPKEIKSSFLACLFPLLVHRLEKECIIFTNGLRVGVIWAQDIRTDPQGTLQQRFRFVVLPLRSIDFRQVVEALSRFGMRGSQLLLPDGQGSHKQRFRFVVLPLAIVKFRQIVEALSRVGMAAFQLLLLDCKGSLR